MRFKRITRLEIDGLDIRDRAELNRFFNALNRIDSKPYHNKIPDSPNDFKFIERRVVYDGSDRLSVTQTDSRHPSSSSSYFERP